MIPAQPESRRTGHLHSVRPKTLSQMEAESLPRVPARIFLWAITIFIIYGSLFPFDFQTTPLSVDHFYNEWHILSNFSDALDNFLLFIPLGIAIHSYYKSTRTRLIATFFAILLLALGIQLLQLYLPSRTSSVSDAFWNTVGLGTGFLIASKTSRLLKIQLSADASKHDYFSILLVLLWFFYESFPFIPTLDIGLLRDHVKTAVFAPPFELMRLLQHWLAATLAGVAILRVNWLHPRYLNLCVMAGIAIFLEVFVAYGSLRRETLMGIALGLGSGYLVENSSKKNSHFLIFFLAFCTYLLTVVLPFRDQPSGASFTLTPFSHLLWQGVTKDIPPAAFEALAIGVMLWAGLANPGRFQRSPYAWTICVIVLLTLLEWIRVYVAGYHGDTTPLIMAIILSPFAVTLRTSAEKKEFTVDQTPIDHPAHHALHLISPSLEQLKHIPGSEGILPIVLPIASDTKKSTLLLIAGTLVVLTLVLWLFLHLPGIPYNVKKIFGDHVLAGSAYFSLVLLWIGSAPWLVAQALTERSQRDRSAMVWLPILLIVMAMVSLTLVDLAIPDIMLNKIIGTPDIYRRVVFENYWGEEWRQRLSGLSVNLVDSIETGIRYSALYSVFTIPLTISALALARKNRLLYTLSDVLLLLPFWWVTKYIVIDNAVTDNLTELLQTHGLIFLAILIVVFTMHASLMANILRRTRSRYFLRWGLLCLLTAALLPATWWLLTQSIESLIVKDGKIFSGVQFILGENRSDLLPEITLFGRWCAFYAGAVTVTASGMYCAMRLWPVVTVPGKKTGIKGTSSRLSAAEK